jgi:hypothetical protein
VPDAPDVVALLQAANAGLRAENAELKAENAELRAQNAELAERVARLERLISRNSGNSPAYGANDRTIGSASCTFAAPCYVLMRPLRPRTHCRISSVKKPSAVACTLQGYALVFRDIHIVTGIVCSWVKDAAGRHSLQHTDFSPARSPAESWALKCGLSRHKTYARM